MSRIFICTTGTSVAAGVGPYASFQAPEDYGRAVSERIDTLRQELASEEWLKRVSAESNSLQATGLGSDDTVYLLHTETEDGRICAEKVAGVLEQGMACGVELRSIEGLQVLDTGRFRRVGIQNLFAAVDSICLRHGGFHGGQSIQLNITGGFKSVVPYLTLYGLLKALPVIYLFERSNQLLTLPPVPLGFDLERLARAHDAMHQLREAGAMPAERFFEAIPGLDFAERRWYEALLEEDDGEVTLSAFGEMLAADLDEQESAQLLLAPGVARRLDKASPAEQERMDMLLNHLRNPLWRQQHRHAFQGTDLAVFKPGSTPDRAAAFLEGNRIFVCELFTNHDEYERVLKGCQRNDYEKADFLPWDGPATGQALPATEEVARRGLEKQIDELNAALEKVRTQAANEEHARHSAEEAAAKLEVESQALAQRSQQLEKEQRELRQNLEQARQALEQAALPWWRKLFSRKH